MTLPGLAESIASHFTHNPSSETDLDLHSCSVVVGRKTGKTNEASLGVASGIVPSTLKSCSSFSLTSVTPHVPSSLQSLPFHPSKQAIYKASSPCYSPGIYTSVAPSCLQDKPELFFLILAHPVLAFPPTPAAKHHSLLSLGLAFSNICIPSFISLG